MVYAATPTSLIPRRQVHRSAAARGRLRFCRTTALVLSAICGSLAAQDTCCTIDAPVGPSSTFKGRTWPKGQVFYTFDSNVSTSRRKATRRAMGELEAAANLRFFEKRVFVGGTVLRFKNHSSRNYVTSIGMNSAGSSTDPL